MPDSLPIGHIFGLELSARRSSIFGSIALWVLFAILGWFLSANPGSAVLFGLVCTLLHWLSEMVHQFGHARAARRTGYPMRGVRLWFVLGQSLYPADEPPLPGRVHVRRALGGPIASILTGCLLGLLALLIYPNNDLFGWVLIVLMLDNLLVLGFGALPPAWLYRWKYFAGMVGQMIIIRNIIQEVFNA